MVYGYNRFAKLNEAADDKKEYNVVPLKSVNGVPFGASREDVRKVFGKAAEFQKTKFSKSKTDNFGSCHCFYDADDKFEAVEIFYGSDIKMNGKYVPWNIDDAKEVMSDLKMVKETKNDNRHYMSKKYQCGMETDADDNGNIHSILFAGKNYYNESSLITEAVKSSIKNPIGKGNLTAMSSAGGWGSDKVNPENIFGKQHSIYVHVFTYDKDASGLNDKQEEAADYYNKNKAKMYTELENTLLAYANSFLGPREQPFSLEQQLNMLFIPDGISIGADGAMSMELENVFDPEHGVFVHMYPGKMYCTCDPIF